MQRSELPGLWCKITHFMRNDTPFALFCNTYLADLPSDIISILSA